MIQDLPIIDFHCHFPVQGDWFPDYEIPKKVQFDTLGSRDHSEIWRKAFNFPQAAPPLSDDEAAVQWLTDIDAKGVEKVVFVSGGGNDRLAAIAARYPERFYAFAHHHPEAEGAADMLEHALRDQGMRGYKLLGPLVDAPLSDRRFYPLWELCGTSRVPVLIHFGLLGAAGGLATGTNIDPLTIAQAALDFPQVNFVVPHFGCTHIEQLLQLMWIRPNVYVDTSGSNQWIRWMPYRLSLEDVIRKFVETVGPGRILFATDSSWMPRGFSEIYLEEQHKAFRFLGLGDDDLHQIFYRNAARLLDLK